MNSAPVEYDVIRNPCFGALVLFSFARKYFSALEQREGPGMGKSLLVLPMVCQLPTRKKIHQMRFDTPLEKSIREEPLILAGLQSRLECFTNLSFQSIRFGAASGLFDVDKTGADLLLIPKRLSMPDMATSASNMIAMHYKAAERLGAWFSRMDVGLICTVLKLP